MIGSNGGVQVPLVSVIIPCLNRAHFLIPTIESVLQQDYPHIECIVVDGGSQDGSADILRSYGTRIHWVSEPDRGHADAINKGWALSRGEVLTWLNADDCWVAPYAVGEAVAYLQSHANVDVVYGQSVRIDAQGRVLGPGYWKLWDLRYALERCHHVIPQPASFIRRGILERVGWLDAAFMTKKDHELWLRIGLIGTIRHLPRLWAQERACPGTWSERGDMTAAACVALTRKFFALPGVPTALQQRRHAAMGGAYLRGAHYALREGQHWKVAMTYALRGLVWYPPHLWHVLRCGSRWVLERLWPPLRSNRNPTIVEGALP